MYTLGVELELVGMTSDRAASCLNAAGVAVVAGGRGESSPMAWKATTDGSLRGAGGAAEVVSPILNSGNFAGEVDRVARVLRANGARVNTTTGTHIHLGVDSWSDNARARFLLNWAGLTTALDLLVSPSRRVNGAGYTWCRRYNEQQAETVAGRIYNGYATGGHPGRYYGLNIEAFDKFGTYEVRLHQGTLNARKIAAWVDVITGLADVAAAAVAVPDTFQDATWDGMTRPLWSLERTTGLLEWLAGDGYITASSSAYLIERAETLDDRAGQ